MICSVCGSKMYVQYTVTEGEKVYRERYCRCCRRSEYTVEERSGEAGMKLKESLSNMAKKRYADTKKKLERLKELESNA